MKDNINSVNKDGNTCAHLAVMQLSPTYNPYALKEMLKAYPNDIDLNIKNNEGKAPLDIAKENGDSYVCAIIEEHQKQYPK
ncbi:MAG: ankyrin repeat domain-containing protein [Candidatus Cardinium sp.]|nr:ankyrin repeat domain-containing protein [Cardinium endosymbiont of Dermatophagoides farinae]UWW97117.1 MAG: ankyrin repeat domain-containing protein [Candidatus Cardinium sp.]